jgi:hypothetical protein
MDIQMIEKYQTFKRGSKLTIKPYVEDTQPNMGLEKYNMALFDNVFHEEPIICLEQNGIKRYVTGLNEFAPEVKALPLEEREAKIKEIRNTVAEIEQELFANTLDVKVKDFWDKVVGLHPTNDKFWEKITIRCGNEPIYLDPQKDVYDRIKLKAIEAGGFSLIAKSLDDVRLKSNKNVKFYLDKYEETATIKTEVKKLRNKALGELQKIYDTNREKLMLVCKVIDGTSSQYRKSTPIDVMYDNMDKYINGETVNQNKKQTATTFLEVANLDMETLKLKSLVKDANYYQIIAAKGDGYIYHLSSNTMMGKNPSDVVEFLKNVMNETLLKDLLKNIEQYWNE